MDKTTLNSEERKVFGRKVKSLRKEGVLPGNVYGKKQKSLAIQVDLKEFHKVFDDVGETGLIELKVGKTTKDVLVDNIQEDPVTNNLLHVDFRQVDLKEKITAEVPIEMIGEAPAEKQGIGTLVQYIDEIEVEALPTDLPDKFEIDVTKLEEVDMAVYVKDLTYDKSKVKIETDLEEIIVKVEPQMKEEVVEPPPAEEEPVEDEETGEEDEKVVEEESKEEKQEEEKE